MIYTITYNKPETKEVQLDFLTLANKLDKSLPDQAYVQGVSLQDCVLFIKTTKSIENLHDIAIRSNTEKYTVNNITTDTTTPLP